MVEMTGPEQYGVDERLEVDATGEVVKTYTVGGRTVSETSTTKQVDLGRRMGEEGSVESSLQ